MTKRPQTPDTSEVHRQIEKPLNQQHQYSEIRGCYYISFDIYYYDVVVAVVLVLRDS